MVKLLSDRIAIARVSGEPWAHRVFYADLGLKGLAPDFDIAIGHFMFGEF
jgi:hypothetical protein